jgi:O-antigen/teichoic acid export membrane protein
MKRQKDNRPHNNLQKDYLWNSIGTSVNSFISLLLLIVVTRVNGLDAAGLFSFSFGLSLVLFTIGLYGGRVYQVSDIHGEFSSESYIVLKFITSILALIAAMVMIVGNRYDVYKSLLILTLVFYKLSEAIADPLYGIIQRHNRLHTAGISLTFKGCAGFLSFLVIDLLTKDILIASASLLCVNILFMLSFDRMNVQKTEQVTLRPASLRTAAANSFALMKKCAYVFAFSFLTTAMANIPRYFIDVYHETDQGYFGILIMPASLLALFVTFIIQPNVVPLSEMHRSGRYDLFARTTGKMLLVALILGGIAIVGAYLIGNRILTLIYGADLMPYRLELTGVMTGGIFNVISSIYSNVLVIIRKQFIQLIIYLSALLTATAMCALLVESCGIRGGVWAYIIANILQAGLFIAAYHVILRKKRLQTRDCGES